MKKGIALILTVLLLLALAACGGNSGSQNQNASPPSQPNTTPSGGGQTSGSNTQTPQPAGNKRDDLVFCWTNKIESLDPLQALYSMQIQLAGAVMERLAGYDDTANVRTFGVAENYTESDGGLTWTFKLRPNIQFHNGTALTSNDVKFSIEQAMGSSYQGQFVDFIQSVEAPDDKTVVLRLKFNCPFGFQMLNKIFILPAGYYAEKGSEGFSDHPIGTGPYKFVSHDLASGNIVVERNENYWGETPSFSRITFRTITDMSTALIALEKGEVDITGISGNEYTSAAANSSLAIGQTKNNILSHLIFNSEVSPSNNKLFRQACAYALDYEALYLLATGGYYGDASSLFFLDMWGEIPTGVTEYNYNPDKAKELLKQSGMALPINLGTVQTTAQNKPPIEAIQQYFATVGINFQIEQVEPGAYIGSLLSGNFRVNSMLGNDAGITAATALDSMLNSSNIPGFNLSRWQSADTDAMLAKMVYAKTDEEYKAAAKDVLAFIQDEAMYVTFAHRSSLYAYNKDLNVYFNSDLEINKFSWK